MNETDVSKEAAALATDLDKSLSGEEVIERLITGIVTLKRENKELKAQLDQVLDKMTVLTTLVDSDHAAIMILMGQRHAETEGIVN